MVHTGGACGVRASFVMSRRVSRWLGGEVLVPSTMLGLVGGGGEVVLPAGAECVQALSCRADFSPDG